MSPSPGRLAVVGLGPGDIAWRTPEASTRLAAATDIVGYRPYVDQAGPLGPHQTAHPSPNRREVERAAHAFTLAAAGRDVVIVSSGDPGIFAMASAVMEVLETDREEGQYAGVEVSIVPGVTAAAGAAARIGAPLGHDLCMISLSDVRKPWEVVEQRLLAAATADFILSLYNPCSAHRPWQLGRALELLRTVRAPDTPVVLARQVGREGESVTVTSLSELDPGTVDMRTVLIVGSSTTRRFTDADGRDWVYTPRTYDATAADEG